MFYSNTVEAPKHTRYALKIVNSEWDRIYGSIVRCEYLDGWMRENIDDWGGLVRRGFNIPSLSNFNKPFGISTIFRNWAYDIISYYEGNHKLALVEVGGSIKKYDDSTFGFEYMRIVKIYPDKITYENLQRRIKQIRKAHRSIFFDKFNDSFWNKETV